MLNEITLLLLGRDLSGVWYSKSMCSKVREQSPAGQPLSASVTGCEQESSDKYAKTGAQSACMISWLSHCTAFVI